MRSIIGVLGRASACLVNFVSHAILISIFFGLPNDSSASLVMTIGGDEFRELVTIVVTAVLWPFSESFHVSGSSSCTGRTSVNDDFEEDDFPHFLL